MSCTRKLKTKKKGGGGTPVEDFAALTSSILTKASQTRCLVSLRTFSSISAAGPGVRNPLGCGVDAGNLLLFMSRRGGDVMWFPSVHNHYLQKILSFFVSNLVSRSTLIKHSWLMHGLSLILHQPSVYSVFLSNFLKACKKGEKERKLCNSSAQSQKGVNALQRCSVENQKGAVAHNRL